MKTIIENHRRTVFYHGAFVLGGIATAFLVCALYAVISTSIPEQVPSPEVATTTQSEMSTSSVLFLPKSEPLKLRIPALHMETRFESPVFLDDKLEMEVPKAYTTVAYYGYGPTPGELGPAVVLGHVDSYVGPAIFYHLGQLKVGDKVEVERDDGTIAIFRVTDLERHDQANFPTQAVFGDVPKAELRLITCSGIYSHGEQRYSHNLIVFAELVATSTVTLSE